MFDDLEQFVTAHRPCGKLTGDVGELEPSRGYLGRVSCSCGAAERSRIFEYQSGNSV